MSSPQAVLKLEKAYTSCKECAFAEYDGITQTGCTIQKLNQHKQNNAQIVEVYDNEAEFYLVNGVFCVYKRSHRWSKRYDDPQAQLLKEIALDYNAIIFANDSIDDFRSTLMSLKDQRYQPSHITAIRYPGTPNLPYEYQLSIQNAFPVEWRISNVTDKSLSKNAMVDMTTDIIKKKVYTVCDAGFRYRMVFSDIIHKLFCSGIPFGIVEHSGMYVVHTFMHKVLSGNAGSPLRDKIQCNDPSMIIQYETLL